MADIKDQLIKDSYNYVLQSDLGTGVVYRIGGDIPVNPIFQSGLTVNSGFTYSNGTEGVGYTLVTDGTGYAYWAPVSAATPSSGVTSVTAGSGLSGNVTTGAVTIVNTAPDRIVTISGGTGITTGGTYPNFTIVNSAPDRTVTITGGTNIEITGSYPDFGVNYTGATTIQGITGITGTSGVSASTTDYGTTIINTAPDQTVTISGGTGITTGGTYPNFTIVNSAPDRTVTITGGTNIEITGTYPDFGVNFTGSTTGGTTIQGITGITGTSGVSANTTDYGTTIINTAPDRTVTITGGTNIQITGTYPDFGVNFTGATTGGTVSGDFLPLSGGTVTGATQFTGGLTANTVSATTYFNLPVSGLTSGVGIGVSNSNGNYTISYTGSSSGSFTGGTVTGPTIFTNGLTANTISATTYFNLPVSGLTSGNGIGLSYSNGNYTISYTGTSSGGTISGDYLPLSGGTLTGGLVANNGVTASTISQTSYIDFTTGSTNPSSVAGRLFFDSTQKALSYFDIVNTQVPIAMGQQLYVRVYNATGVQIDKGKVIAITGTSNNLPSAILAVNNHSLGSPRPIGLAAENIPINREGLVIVNGILSGITLNTFRNGATLYLSDTIPGQYVDSTASLAFSARTNEIGYVLQTGSTTGKIYVTINNEDSNLTLTDIERNILEGNVISSGVYEFTGITQGTGQTINVAMARGWIVKNTYSFATLPDVINLYYSGGTNIPLTYLNTAVSTYILISSASTLVQQTTFPTPQERRENIYLGRIGHADRLTITNLQNATDFDVSPMAAIRDLWTPLKLINQGIIVSPHSTNLQINTSAGILWGNGIGWFTNQQNPDSVTISGTSPTTFQYRTRNGPITGGTITSGNTTTIEPGYYDLNGVVTAVGGGSNSSTNQRVFLFPTGLVRIQLGQQVYGNLAAAVAGSQTEQFTDFGNNRDNAILIGIISVNKNATNLSLAAQAVFNLVSKFGEVLGGTGGLSTTTLQQAYDNSATPEIVTNSAEGALSIKNGTGGADNVTNLLEGQNSGGTTTSFIRADGAFSGKSIFATTISATTYQNLPQSVSGAGTTNYIPKWIDSTGLGDSQITDDGTYVTIGGNLVTVNSDLLVNQGITATTISATTYFNLPVSGLTNGNNISVTGSNGNFTISFTGGTVSWATNFTGGLSANTISATTITATNYNNLPVSGLTSGSGIGLLNSNGNYTISFTGGTITGSTNFTGGLSANTISATTISATNYQNLPLDVFVTGGTYSSGSITFSNNSGGTFTVTGLPIGGQGGQVYYFNTSVTQTPYKEFGPTGTSSSEQTTTISVASGVTSTIQSYLTPVGYPNSILIPGGVWSFYLHTYKQDILSSFDVYCDVYLKPSGGPETYLFSTDPFDVTSTTSTPSMGISDGYFSGKTINISDRILVLVKATNTGTLTKDITFVTEGNLHYSYGITTFTNLPANVTSLNATNGISGNTTTGAVTIVNTDKGSSQNIFKNIQVAGVTQFSAGSNSSNLNFSGINITITSAGTNTLVFSAGTGGGGGGISGSGTANYIPKFTSSSSIGNSQLQDSGSQIFINEGTSYPFARVSISSSATTGIFARGTQYGIYGGLSGNASSSAGVYGEAGVGQYGVYGSNVGNTAGTYIGVFGNGAQADSGVGGTIYIGGKFYGDPGTGAGYSVWLQDGTEGFGKILVSQTSDGKANWSDTLPSLNVTGRTSSGTISATTYENLPSLAFTNGYGFSGTTTKQVSLTSTQVFATATTTISLATYADINGCSVTLAAGTWLITGHVVIAAANLIIQGFVAITDSSNVVVAASALSRPASATPSLNSPIAVSWSVLVSPSTSTTYKLRAARGLTTHTSTYTVYNGTGFNTANHANDGSNKGTNILAIRIS